MFKKKKTWIILVVILLVILVIWAVIKGQSSSGLPVSVEAAEYGDIIETVSANGKIQPAQDVIISPYISGEVVELYVKEGDEVKTGDLLVKIDPEIYISAYERAEANLNSQQANLANAKARLAQSEASYKNTRISYERNKKLWEENVISQSEYDAALANFEVAKAEVDAAKQTVASAEFAISSAKATLREAKDNLTKTTVSAPRDGTVSKLNVEQGERVAGASQFSAGTEIMRIANLQHMEVNVEVNENDIVRVSLNDTCTIEVDAYLNEEFLGVVTEIATSANTVGVSAEQVTNFDVKIMVLPESYESLIPEDKPNYSPLRPGMSATVEIRTEYANNVLIIPIGAVTTRSDTTENNEIDRNTEEERNKDIVEVVFVYDDGFARMQEVEIGIQDNTNIEIKSGLEEGDEVVTGPYSLVSKSLRDGNELRKTDRKDLFKED
ncbi:MAG: efflux RND transporter periplasmic adaptor subunit [Bacteroidales bacterium]|jgi:HlyD family secretion protein|nr:efflux RND transporter periplasmic adaptor subunit [Bacteroidales bacterium]